MLYGWGFGGDYPAFRRYWEQELMLPSYLPPDPYPWHWVTVAVLALFAATFAIRDVSQRQTAPRILSSGLRVNKVKHGLEKGDGTVDYSYGQEQFHVEIDVVNDPVSLEIRGKGAGVFKYYVHVETSEDNLDAPSVLTASTFAQTRTTLDYRDWRYG
ncbi:MAG: hypothetical protein O3C65_15100 [Proteobacteria bacterium]|nr:hypothetical protein [Pseudomonadota bacterium]